MNVLLAQAVIRPRNGHGTGSYDTIFPLKIFLFSSLFCFKILLTTLGLKGGVILFSSNATQSTDLEIISYFNLIKKYFTGSV